MGKANRPLVIRIKKGQSEAEAMVQAQKKPRFKSRKRTRVMVIRDAE